MIRKQKAEVTIPETGFVRINALLTIVPMSRVTLWRMVRDGRFPPPVKLGRRMVAFRVEDVRTWVNGRQSTA